MTRIKRTKTTLLILVFALLAGALAIALIREARTAPCLAYSDEAAYQALLAGQKNIEKEDYMGTLLAEGERVPYDQKTHTYYLPQPLDGNGIVGLLTWSDPSRHAYFTPDVLQTDYRAAIAEGHAFEIAVTDGKTYFIEKLILSGLPTARLDTVRSMFNRFGDGQYTGEFAVFSIENGKMAVTSSLMSLRLRGNSSLQYPKHSYHVDLYCGNQTKNTLSVLGMAEDDAILFNALYNDESKVRDKASIDLWNELTADSVAGLPHTDIRYAELVYQGNYHGLYGLVLPMQWKSQEESDILYKIRWRLPEGSSDAPDYAPDRSKMGSTSTEIKIPSAWTGESLWDPVTEYVRAFYLETDAVAPDARLSLIDPSNVIDHGLLVQLTAAVDNVNNNMYLLARRENGGYRIYKAPWDMDRTWGADFGWSVHAEPELNRSDFVTADLRMLIEDARDEYLPAIQSRWEFLRRGLFSEKALTDRLTGLKAELIESGALQRDSARWPESENQMSLDELTSFLHERLPYLDEWFHNPLSAED